MITSTGLPTFPDRNFSSESRSAIIWSGFLSAFNAITIFYIVAEFAGWLVATLLFVFADGPHPVTEIKRAAVTAPINSFNLISALMDITSLFSLFKFLIDYPAA